MRGTAQSGVRRATSPPLADCLQVMAKAVAKTKKIAAKSKPSMPARVKAAPPARKALAKGPAKPAPKPSSKVVASKPAADAPNSGQWVFPFADAKADGKARLRA